MERTLNEMIFLYQLSEDLYKGTTLRRVLLSEVNLNTFIDLSMKNNMFYYHSKKILDSYTEGLNKETTNAIRDIINKGNYEFKKIGNSILLLNDIVGDYLLIKTYRGYPRIPNDLDVLVSNFDGALEIITKKGFKIAHMSSKRRDAQLISKDFYKIHLHSVIHWVDSEFMDNGFIFNNPRLIEFGGARAKIPNFDADFLIHMAHINFEPLHITLSELLYIYIIFPQVNRDIVLGQSQKYSWRGALMDTLEIMDKIYHTVYNAEPCPFISFNFRHIAFKKPESIILPMSLPRAHLIRTCIEKKLFKQALSKASKSLKILLSGDSYSGYYFPVEEYAILSKNSLIKD